MFTTRRQAAIGITALATVASTIALAVPAQAAVAPAWPASRLPTGAGCAITSVTPYSVSSSGLNEYTFTDTQTPTITNWTVNNQASVLVLKPGTTSATFRLLASQTCGGTGAVLSGLLINGVRKSNGFPFALDSTDAFQSRWATGVTVTPSDAAAYRIPSAAVLPRYATFTLTDNWSLVGSTPFAGSATTVTGPWSTKVFYMLRATTLSNALSATKLKKGKTVKATAQLKMASGAVYAADAGAKVAVQTKVGAGKWTTRATLTANASGVVTYSFVLAATTSVRFIHAATHSGNFTNGVVSAIKTVTRI